MAVEVKVPELGENIHSADVVSVLVKPGDTVRAEQPLIEVESDKASVEVPSPSAGVVSEVRVKVGQKLKIGQVIVVLAEGAEGQQPPAAEPTKASPASETATAAGPAASPAAPAPTAPPAPAGARAQPGPVSRAQAEQDSGEPVPASPSTRRLARELGVNIRRVSGSGPGGRISMQDVKDYTKSVVQRRMGEPTSGHVGESPQLPDFTQWGAVRREPMSSLRKRTADKMVQSWINVPHVTQFDEADITDLEEYRREKSKVFEKQGAKLTVTAAVVKITALALRRFEKFNASTDMDHDEIIYKDYVNVGVAVDTPRGLLVPVVKNADQKGLLQIAREISDLASRARERKVQPDELQGGTLSVTNLGGLGTTYFTPIINFPDSAVLGVGRAKQQPVWRGSSFEPRLIMPLSISYDHRIIDGADAARFLRWIVDGLEQPLNILL